MARPRKRKTKRVILVVLVCLSINAYILYSVGIIFKDVYDKKIEKKELSSKLVSLKEEEEKLQVEADKLQDPEYVAKYAREKFLYSGKNEYIVKIK